MKSSRLACRQVLAVSSREVNPTSMPDDIDRTPANQGQGKVPQQILVVLWELRPSFKTLGKTWPAGQTDPETKLLKISFRKNSVLRTGTWHNYYMEVHVCKIGCKCNCNSIMHTWAVFFYKSIMALFPLTICKKSEDTMWVCLFMLSVNSNFQTVPLMVHATTAWGV